MQAPDCFRQQLLAAIPRLRRYARSLIFDSASADDLVQTTLERGLSHWHQFDQRRDMLVWLLSIAHNAFLDQRRRDARMSFVDPAQATAQQDLQRADPGVDIGCASTCWPRWAGCRWTTARRCCWSAWSN